MFNWLRVLPQKTAETTWNCITHILCMEACWFLGCVNFKLRLRICTEDVGSFAYPGFISAGLDKL